MRAPSLFQTLVQDHRDALHATPQQHATLRCLARCGTAAAGYHRWQCLSCGHQDHAYNCCRNRHCPLCQAGDRRAWVQAREAELLPVPYFHVVCTVPHQLLWLARRAPSIVYDGLLRCARQAITDITNDPRHLGAQVAQVQVLHTWGSDLRLHPHVHSIVSGGGLTPDGTWMDCRYHRKQKRPFLVPVRVLSARFRTLMLDFIRDQYRRGAFATIDHPMLRSELLWQAQLRALRRLRWVTYAKRPFGSPQQVVRYLGRYTHRVAVTDHRLARYTGETIDLSWTDYRQRGRRLVTTLTAQQFLQRFVQHILPTGFRRIRMAGLLAPRIKQQQLARAQQLLAHRQRPPDPHPPVEATTVPGERRCPECGAPTWLVSLLVRPTRAGPPNTLIPAAYRRALAQHTCERRRAS
jgi:hypothetical protein